MCARVTIYTHYIKTVYTNRPKDTAGHERKDLSINKLCWRPPRYALVPCKLTFDLLTLKVVSESRVTWPTSVPSLVFLGLSVLDLGPMYATDRQTSDAHYRLMSPT